MVALTPFYRNAKIYFGITLKPFVFNAKIFHSSELKQTAGGPEKQTAGGSLVPQKAG